MVYKDYKFYGPYLSKKDNRLRCILVNSIDNKRITLSYPKYLMEVHLNRYLDKNETVHHLDGNPLNNNLNNLVIMNKQEHCFCDAKKNENVIVHCSFCGTPFLIEGSKLHNRNRSDKNQSGYFCSKTCSGKYGKLIQLGLINPKEKVDRIKPKKYRGKSAPEET